MQSIPSVAPEMLLALYATIDGVGAREIARLTETCGAYRRLCGGMQVKRPTVSDFRRDPGDALDEILSVSLACLMAAGGASRSPSHEEAWDGMELAPGKSSIFFRHDPGIPALPALK